MKNLVKPQTIALLCIFLFLGGCKNPFIDRILGSKVNKDEEDFGPGASVIVLNVDNSNWTSAIATITAPGNYVINVTGDVTTLTPLNVAGALKVSIRGNHTITRSSLGNLLTVNTSQTYILRSPLKGNTTNNVALVSVLGGDLIMWDGASITGNTNNAASLGGGVLVNNGTFTMYGGIISGNATASSTGGGVSVSAGTFTMSGGTISGNSSGSTTTGGGGVSVNGGTFTMSGGTISSNSARNGGGVYVSSGFTKTGGIIYGNDAGGNSNYAAAGGQAAYRSTPPTSIDYTLKPRVSGFVRW